MSSDQHIVSDETTSPSSVRLMNPKEFQAELPDASNTNSGSPLSPPGSSYEISSNDEGERQQLDQEFREDLLQNNNSNRTSNQQDENEDFSTGPTMSINHQQYPIDLEQIQNVANQQRQHHQQQSRVDMDAVKFQQEQGPRNDFDDVKHIDLFGVQIVALTINGRERLCLAQISNTLLKEFSYNEIHNRRVALGITCVQCTPVQLEMLRRAGAMPSSSRRCGMITMREAERLCRSFLVEEQPPELPENFYFTIAHRVNYGCKGRFIPARYISSRAKCIECFYCGEFYSPNKFIFHSHKQPNRSDCNPPDSPNINSWRKHIDLDYSQDHSQEIKYAWEDVKSLFNGGTRRRAPNNMGTMNLSMVDGSVSGRVRVDMKRQSDDDQLIDVEFDECNSKKNKIELSSKSSETEIGLSGHDKEDWPTDRSVVRTNSKTTDHPKNNQKLRPTTEPNQETKSLKRPASMGQNQPSNKRFSTDATIPKSQANSSNTFNGSQQINNHLNMINPPFSSSRGSSSGCSTMAGANFMSSADLTSQTLPDSLSISDHLINRLTRGIHSDTGMSSTITDHDGKSLTGTGPNFPSSPGSSASLDMTNNNPTSFIYSQLYSQLMQPQRTSNQQMSHRAPSAGIDAQLALRHHIWSSILANIQCNAAAAAVVSANQNMARATLRNQPQAYSLPVCSSAGQQSNPSNHLTSVERQSVSLGNLPNGDSRLATSSVSNFINMNAISSQTIDRQNQTAQNGLQTASYNNDNNCN